jgi:predicted metal-dependent hydrolase
MLVRRPRLDFENARPVWSKNAEFSMIWNAMSFSAPSSEIYLNRVMSLCARKLGPEHSELQATIETFIKQESTHLSMHARYNDLLYAQGFDAVRPLEEAQHRSLTKLLETKSLAFNAAYCAGFENITLFAAKFIFEEAEDLFEGADAAGADLWRWHMAEEYEHRAVCHDVFAAISGNYFLRVYGAIYSILHLTGYVGRVATVMLEKHREHMTPPERKASIARQNAYLRRHVLYNLPRALRILVPFYDPARVKRSPMIESALERYAAACAR